MAVGTRCADHVTPLYPQKLALTSPTGGGPSVGIVRSRTKATEFLVFFIIIILNLRTATFKAYCAILVRLSNFRHQASPRVSPLESTQRRKVKLWFEKYPVILSKCRFTRYI